MHKSGKIYKMYLVGEMLLRYDPILLKSKQNIQSTYFIFLCIV